MDPFKWTPQNVSSTRPANAMIRTLIEAAELRSYLSRLPLQRVADVGCGFGRLTHVAALHAAEAVGIERETKMVYLARKLVPSAEFLQADKLWDLPFEDNYFDLAYTFTVLQHMDRDSVVSTIEEMKRLAKWVLIVEDTDPRRHVTFEDGHVSNGRPVWWYRQMMRGYRLVRLSLREVEPGFHRGKRTWRGIGHFMLFERERAQ